MRINKKGSYIVEATICLPLLIIAIVVMSSIILYYSCIEDTAYIMATEMRRTAIEAAYGDSSALLPVRVGNSVIKAHSSVSKMNLREYGYRKNFNGIDDVIFLKYRMELETKNPTGIASRATYYPSYATRAYVGRIRDVRNMPAEEFMREGDETVYIFPKDGEKYHKSNCTFVKVAPKSVVLNSEIRSRYMKCPTCGSESAEDGSVVYIFPNYGEAYHYSNCPSIVRKCIEIEETIAIDRGYTACSKCGG